MADYNKKVLEHLLKTKQTFCFGQCGEFYTLEDLLTQKLGHQVEFEEMKEILQDNTLLAIN